MMKANRANTCRFVLAVIAYLVLGHAIRDRQSIAEFATVPRRLTNDGGFKQSLAWSPDGQAACYAKHEGANIWLWLWEEPTRKAFRLTKREFPEYGASYSPDGKRMAFCCVKYSGGQGNVDLCTIAAHGGDSKLLIGDQGGLSHEESPAWSPDGRRVAFTSTRDGNQEIYIIDVDGQNLNRITNDPGIDAHPAWTSDGRHLVFATSRWGDLEIASTDTEGKIVNRLTNSRRLDDYPSCSPKSDLIAWTSARSGDFEIWVMTTSGGSPKNVSQHKGIDNYPAWKPNGELTWISNREGDFEIYMQPID